MNSIKIAVIGAGVSGMSVAHILLYTLMYDTI